VGGKNREKQFNVGSRNRAEGEKRDQGGPFTTGGHWQLVLGVSREVGRKSSFFSRAKLKLIKCNSEKERGEIQ